MKLIAALLILLCAGCTKPAPQPIGNQPVAELKWGKWYEGHAKGCKDCGNQQEPRMCMKAFERLQQMFVDAEKEGWKFSVVDGWHRVKK